MIWRLFSVFLWFGTITTAWATPLLYQLDLSIDPQQRQVQGALVITSTDAQTVHFTLAPTMQVSLQGSEQPSANLLSLDLEPNQPRHFSYQMTLPPRDQYTWIDARNVFLSGVWYPQPTDLARYQLSVTLPKGFIANAEADQIQRIEHGDQVQFLFQLAHPLDSLHLAASQDYVLHREQYQNITLEAYFFREDADLIDTYLQHSRDYLHLYQSLLAPYPFQRFAIVANRLPTGYSMPTYTLLGQQVLRLPFIVKTSLGHEILHQWLGNAVYSDYNSGNWSEGLTTYLADHYYQVQAGQGAAYRKNLLLKYQAYVTPANAQPARAFRMRHDALSSATGYNKVALLFHMLQQHIGEEAFWAALKQLLQQYTGQKAAWGDLIALFEASSGQALTGFFQQWLDRTDIPQITVETVTTEVVQGQVQVQVTVQQHTDPPYHLRLPFRIELPNEVRTEWVTMDSATHTVTWRWPLPPLSVRLDPDYEVMRQLHPDEIPPTLDALMGQTEVIVALPETEQALYQPLLDALHLTEVRFKTPDEVTFAELRDHTVFTSALTHPLVTTLFAEVQPPAGAALWLQARRHPYQAKQQIVLMQAADADAIAKQARRVPHYGQYSEIRLYDAKPAVKQLADSAAGWPVLTRSPLRAIQPATVKTLTELTPQLLQQRIVYVGEQHDNFAHHLNQLAVIKLLHNSGEPLTIGLEMFQRPYQAALDDYSAGRIDEQTFLTQTEYFTRWGYDYQLYKPILDYARQHHIPLLALNIDGAITRQVAREGWDSLTAEQRTQLPRSMDASNAQYQADLKAIFQVHQQQQGHSDSDYFLQAQLLWDETMAETVADYLAQHPDQRMVVIAGNGHIRHHYGIPARVARRHPVPYLTLVQGESITPGIADYVLLSEPLSGQTAPRLGVAIEEQAGQVVVMHVMEESVAAKAGVQANDVLRQLAEQAIHSLSDLKFILLGLNQGETTTLHVERDGQVIDLTIHF